ncbi:rhodanese-like domain-containing protein, partial [bacterium]|nr:rhodanese-like domain-containing protein [bacterium]
LPDTTKVYPGHGAGSMCGKALSSDKISTIGKEKMTNYALKCKNQNDFIKIICENQPTPPKYFAMDVEINKNGAKPLGEILSNLKPFSTQEILLLENQGAIVLDSRNHLEFSKKCIPNSLNVGIEGQFATWSGCVLDKNSKVVVIAPKGKEQETAIRLARVGIDTVLGYLEGGIDAWQGETITKNRVKPQDLNDFLKNPNLQLIDIRGTGEFQTERLKGFVNLPLNSLANHLGELNPEKETLLFCKSSYRSSVARTYLENIGFKKVTDVEGGLLACKEKGIEVITEACPNS